VCARCLRRRIANSANAPRSTAITVSDRPPRQPSFDLSRFRPY
jgi:hypothetical protein